MTISDAKHRSDVYPSAAPGDDMLGGLGYATMSIHPGELAVRQRGWMGLNAWRSLPETARSVALR